MTVDLDSRKLRTKDFDYLFVVTHYDRLGTSVEDLAHFLEVSERTVYRWLRMGRKLCDVD